MKSPKKIPNNFQIPSPLQKVEIADFKPFELDFYIKRDDLIHPTISGNKWRKLEFVLEDAHQKNIKTLVSFGGAYSNHLLALAAAGVLNNFKTIAFVRGEKPKILNPILEKCLAFGMELIFVSRLAYKNKSRLFEEYCQNKSDVYFIDEGGKSPFALLGCKKILEEIKMPFDHVFLPVGTGTTLAGICLHENPILKKTKIEGIVVLKGMSKIENEIKKLAQKEIQFKLHHNYHFGGYAKMPKELLEIRKKFTSETNIKLDLVYNSKAWAGILDLAKNGYFKPKSKILMIHTGGIFSDF